MKQEALVVATMLLCSCKHVVFVQDISPNSQDGADLYLASPAGLTYELAGEETALYAVTLDAGVFKASPSGGPWKQLAGSPRWASCIEVDPTNQRHVVVGERNGDSTTAELNRSGLWESFDAGDTWALGFSPLTQPGCRAANDASISAVAFSLTGTLFVGTACGVGRREGGSKQFSFSATPPDVGAVKAFSLSYSGQGGSAKPILWARADGVPTGFRVLWSDDDGAHWTSVALPAKQDGYGIATSLRGDEFTVAAVGDTALLGFRPSDTTSDPSLWHPKTDNFNTVLYFFRQTGAFKVQTFKSNPASGDGTGLGGRKRVRSFLLVTSKPTTFGSGVRAFYIGGQDLLEAAGVNADGTFSWTRRALTTSEHVHHDLWDVHVTATTKELRLATDGGVYVVGNEGWVSQNDGLHTHHVHTLTMLRGPTQRYPRLAYVVTDNSEWFRPEKPLGPPFEVASGDWQTYHETGDGSWSAGDEASPAVALIVRNTNLTFVTDFGRGMPSGAGVAAGQKFLPVCLPSPDGKSCSDLGFGNLTFAVIQTPPGETPEPLLDVVMLLPVPVTTLQSGAVIPVRSGPLARVTSATGAPVLVRNRRWLANPDVNRSQYAGWELVANDLPAGVTALWVSGGHASTVYYVAAVGLSGATSIWRHDTGQVGWTRLYGIGAAVQPVGAMFGPLHVNPYDPNHLFVSTFDGVRVTSGTPVGAQTAFTRDDVLTALVTESGRYDVSLVFNGGNCLGVIGCSQAGAFPKRALGKVAFLRGAGHSVVVAAPVAGVFFASDDQRRWISLAQYLPRPYTMVSDAAWDGETAFVAFEGRGVFRFVAPDGGQTACWFERAPPTSGAVAKLDRADGVAAAGLNVQVWVSDNGVETAQQATTDQSGSFDVPGSTGKVLHLRFAGSDDVSSCETSFRQ